MTKEERLLAEARKRMQQIYEYSYFNDSSLEEEGEDPNAGAAAPAGGSNAMGDPNMMGGDPNAAAPAGDPNAMGAPNAMPPGGGDSSMMGGDPNAMGDPNMVGGDPSMMGGDMGANLVPNAGMDGGDPNAMGDPNMVGGDPSMMGGDMGAQPGSDDNVVDITQLTDAQDALQANQVQTAEQLEDVDSKLSTLLGVVNKFTKALDANDAKIAELKSELIKRTPTEEETMNVRLNAGGNPFDQKPEEFWDKFEDVNNHYNITSNNDAPQYQIKKADIDNVNDKMVSDDFDEIPRTLHDYFVK